MRRLLLLFVFLACAAPVSAQNIGSWTFKIYNAGAQSPLSTTPIPIASAQCGQTAKPAGGSVNPTDLWWDDPNAVGKFCHYVSLPTDPLISMPISPNPLEGALVANSVTGLASPDSARVPFTKPGTAPAAPTGFILR